MPENDSISYFSTLGSTQASRVRVAPAVKTELPSLPAANTNPANNTTPESDSDTNTSSNALREDTLTISKLAESLSTEDLRLIQKLTQRNREVRAHEAAHLSAAGGYARGGASFTYQRGPNGVSYAIGGEVSLDTSSPSDPKQALDKANTIRAAALAPAQPSTQDRLVAGQAAQTATQARVEITEQNAEELRTKLEQGDSSLTTDEETVETAQQGQNDIPEYQNNSENRNRGQSLNTEA